MINGSFPAGRVARCSAALMLAVASIGATPAQPRDGARAPTAPDRVYTAVTFNRAPVRNDTWFRSARGDHHWVRLDEAVLRLRADRTFRITARYYRDRRSSRTAPGARERVLLNDAADGVYSIRGDVVTFHVRPRNGRNRATTITGRRAGNAIVVDQTIVDGTDRHQVPVRFQHDPSLW